MAQEYSHDFWIETVDGRKLFPARIRHRISGRVTFRELAPGSNRTADNLEHPDAVSAIEAFLRGACIRFGAPGCDDRAFVRDSPLILRLGYSPGFKAANPSLSL